MQPWRLLGTLPVMTVLLTVLAPVRPSCADPMTGEIQVTVLDDFQNVGDPMSGVPIDLYRSPDGTSWTYLDNASTDEQGQHTFTGLSMGWYRVSVWLECYQPVEPAVVELGPGGTAAVTLYMNPMIPDPAADIVSPTTDQPTTAVVPVLVRVKQQPWCYEIRKYHLRAVDPLTGYYVTIFDGVDLGGFWMWQSLWQDVVWSNNTVTFTLPIGEFDTRAFANRGYRLEGCAEFANPFGPPLYGCSKRPSWPAIDCGAIGWWWPYCPGLPPEHWSNQPDPGESGFGDDADDAAYDEVFPLAANLTIENVAVSSGNEDYLVYRPDGSAEQQHPTVSCEIHDSTREGQPAPEYDWAVYVRDTNVGDWTAQGAYQITGHATGGLPITVQAVVNGSVEGQQHSGELTEAGTYTFDIHVVQTNDGEMEADEYWYKQPYDLRIPATMPGTGEPGHYLEMIENESQGYDVRYGYYLQDRDPNCQDATSFQVDLLRPDLTVRQSHAGGPSGTRTNVPHLGQPLVSLTAAELAQYPGTWRAVFTAVDSHGGNGDPRWRRLGENKRMLAVNCRFRVRPGGIVPVAGPVIVRQREEVE